MKELFKRPLFLILVTVLLALIGVEVATLRFSLAQRLISNDDAARNRALGEIAGLDADKRQQLIAELLKQQQNAKPRPKRHALYAVRVAGGKSPEVIATLVGALSNNDLHVVAEAQRALLEIGEPALPAVAAAAKTDNDAVRESALFVLEKSGAAGVGPLASLLKQPPARALPVVDALGRMGEIAKPAVPDLIALFESPDAALRLEAAIVANALERPAPPALPVFMRALKERPWDKKSAEIARALEDMGTAAKKAAPELTALMLRSNDSFSDPAAAKPVLAQTLSALDPRRSELIDLGFDLKQKNTALRYRAAYQLSVMDPPNMGALEIAVGAINDPDPSVAARALVALKRIGLEKTERLGAQAKIKAAEARVRAKNIEGFNEIYSKAN